MLLCTPHTSPRPSDESGLPPSVLAGLDLPNEGDSCFTILRQEEAVALVMSALKVMRLAEMETEALRSYVRQVLESHEKICYSYENPIDEIADDFVWMMG